MQPKLFLTYLLTLFLVSSCNKNEITPDQLNKILKIAGGSQNVGTNFFHFTPKVITPDAPENIILEIHNKLFSGDIIHLETAWGATVVLNDTGTEEDKIAHDNIYTAPISKQMILSRNTPSTLNRPFIGTVVFTQGGFLSLFAEVYAESIPILAVKPVSETVQQTDHLVNIASTSISPENLKNYIQSFYSHYPDQYDFINIIYPGFNLNRHHIDVKNTILGIGKSQINLSGTYGSSGRLIGVNVFPNTTYYDGANRGFQHELGHQWINFLRGVATDSAIPHWPLSDLANSIMGYSPGGGQGLPFNFNLIQQTSNSWLLQTNTQPAVFNDLELYLMGIIPPTEVGPHIVFTNGNQTIKDGSTLTGPVTTLTIDDIINTFGARVPDSSDSPKQFRIGTIIVSHSLLNALEMSFYDYYTTRAELKQEVQVVEGYGNYLSKPFYLSTGERAVLKVNID